METPVTDHLDSLVTDYLRRLDAAAVALPYDRRVELVGEIREHIEQARTAGGISGEASLRDLLDRLGDPDEIVAAAAEDGDVPPTQPPPTQPPAPPAHQPYAQAYQPLRKEGIGLEIAAVLLMTVGSILPFVGWVVGTVLLWMSRKFLVWEKVLMTAVVPGGPFLFLGLAFLVGGQACSSTTTTDAVGNTVELPPTCSGFAFAPWVGIPLFVLAAVGPFVIGGILLRRVGDRARNESLDQKG